MPEFGIFSKNALTGTPELDAGLATGGVPGGPSVLSSVALPHEATTLGSKGLGAVNRLIVACDTLKLRATSACASPLARRLMRRQSCRSPELHATGLRSVGPLLCARSLARARTRRHRERGSRVDVAPALQVYGKTHTKLTRATSIKPGIFNWPFDVRKTD